MDRYRARVFAKIVASLCIALPLYAHAVLLSATPGVSQVISGPDVPMTLRFNTRVDAKRSALVLVAPGGHSAVITHHRELSTGQADQ